MRTVVQYPISFWFTIQRYWYCSPFFRAGLVTIPFSILTSTHCIRFWVISSGLRFIKCSIFDARALFYWNTITILVKRFSFRTIASLNTFGGAVSGYGEALTGVSAAIPTLPVNLACWTMDSTLSDLWPPVNHSALVNTEVRVACYYRTQAPQVGSIAWAHIIKTVLVGLFRWHFWVAFLKKVASEYWTFFFCLFSELGVDITGMVQVIFYSGAILIQPPTKIM